MHKKITSITNPKIKELVKLQKPKYCKQNKQYLIYGETLVQEAILKNSVVEVITITNQIYPCKTLQVNEQIMNKLFKIPNIKVGAVVKDNSNQDFQNGHVLVLEAIQDPGNVGTLIRTARAFGIRNVVLDSNSASVYNLKVVRAMQAAQFDMIIKEADIQEYLKSSNLKTITTFLNKTSTELPNSSESYNIVLGNEGNGLSEELKQYSDYNYIIDIDYESLNVATSGAIIMYELTKENK